MTITWAWSWCTCVSSFSLFNNYLFYVSPVFLNITIRTKGSVLLKACSQTADAPSTGGQDTGPPRGAAHYLHRLFKVGGHVLIKPNKTCVCWNWRKKWTCFNVPTYQYIDFLMVVGTPNWDWNHFWWHCRQCARWHWLGLWWCWLVVGCHSHISYPLVCSPQNPLQSPNHRHSF